MDPQHSSKRFDELLRTNIELLKTEYISLNNDLFKLFAKRYTDEDRVVERVKSLETLNDSYRADLTKISMEIRILHDDYDIVCDLTSFQPDCLETTCYSQILDDLCDEIVRRKDCQDCVFPIVLKVKQIVSLNKIHSGICGLLQKRFSGKYFPIRVEIKVWEDYIALIVDKPE